MSLTDYKLTDAAIARDGVVAAPDRLTGTATQNKMIFDRLIRDTVKGLINGLIDELSGAGGAADIGMTEIGGVVGGNVQTALESLKTLLDTKSASADMAAALSLKSEKSVTNMHIKSVSFDSDSGVFTFTRENGSSVAIDTALEKITTNWRYDPATTSLILTLADGSTQSVSLSALITETEFLDSEQIAFSVNGHTVTATVQSGSITDSMLSSALIRQLQDMVSDAADSAADALQCRNAANASAELARGYAHDAADFKGDAEAWAIGKRNGDPVPSGDRTYQNNAKYWAERSAADKQSVDAAIDGLQDAVQVLSGTVETFAGLQALLRAGLIHKAVSVGDQFSAAYNGTAQNWDVQGIDEDEPVDPARSHVLSVQARKILTTCVFDPPQYLYAVTEEAWPDGLPAGTYHIVLDHGAFNGGVAEDGSYQFTTAETVPVGGGIRHTYIGSAQSGASGYAKGNVLAGTFRTYAADGTTVIESGLATAEGGGGVSLGAATACDPQYRSGSCVNYTQRQMYGSNRWSTSFIRQWLNSDEEVMAFVPATIWSRPPGSAYEGFLHKLDPELRAVLGKVRKRYALSVTDGYGYEDVEDFVTLNTLLDCGGGKNNNIFEGAVDANGTVTRAAAYSLWKTRTANADRIKYNGSSAAIWWLGSVLPSSANSERYVGSSGSLYYSDANTSRGVAPSLYII